MLRTRAVLGGAAIVVVVALKNDFPTYRAAARLTCAAAAAGPLCDAVTGLQTALRRPILPLRTVAGVIDPAISRTAIDETISWRSYARSHRTLYAVTGRLQQRKAAAFQFDESQPDYERDLLVPISSGGEPLGRRDLWLKRQRGLARRGLANLVVRTSWPEVTGLVCAHRISLETPQHAIARNWTDADQRCATLAKMAQYLFRRTRDGRA